MTFSRIYITIDFVIETLDSNGKVEFAASSHMEPFLKPNTLRVRLRQATRALKTHNFDTIAFRGMSGAFLGPALAARLNKKMILVRKKNDDSHSGLNTEGYRSALKYIIVDDFVCSGQTRDEIIQAVDEFAPQAVCLGVLEVCYISQDYRPSLVKPKPYELANRPSYYTK